MKIAQLNVGDALIKEVVIIADPWEALQIGLAVKAYAASKRKNKRLSQLVEDCELASMFY